MSHRINTLFVGKVLFAHELLESTNKTAIEMIKNGALIAEGTCVSSQYQSFGQGQRGNTWESEAGKNILISIILKPHFLQPKDQFILNQITALAITDVLFEYDINPRFIKWPNDVYVGTEKTAGILVQNILKGSIIEHAVIGIGLNVNQVFFPDNLSNPTSLRKQLGKEIPLQKVRANIFEAIERRYLQAQNNTATLLEEYEELLYAKNQIRNFMDVQNNKNFTGVIQGVDQTGKLQIQVDQTLRVFDFKEVAFL